MDCCINRYRCGIHCAAIAHVVRDKADDLLHELQIVNVEGTLNLARQAALNGVKRFIFISSVKVNGECSIIGRPHFAEDTIAPDDVYGQSKAAAEEGLRLISLESDMEVVVIRPPLIYGMESRQFFEIERLCRPWFTNALGCATTNQRSFVALDNLIDLILTCAPPKLQIKHSWSLMEKIFPAELLRRIGKAKSGQSFCFQFRQGAHFAFCLLGKKACQEAVGIVAGRYK